MPMLKYLNIQANSDYYQWKRLIASLSQLIVFKFKFACSRINEDTNILDKFQEFQSDFWHKQHH